MHIADGKIADTYLSTHSAYKAARTLGIGPASVYRSLQRSGVQTRGHQRDRRFSEDAESEIALRYGCGELSGDLAREHDCSVFLIRAIARRYGCEVGPRGNRYREFTASEREEMKRLYADRVSQERIASILGTSQLVVSRVLSSLGVKRTLRVGPGHGSWRGGRTTGAGGYVLLWVGEDDPFACMRSRVGYVPEHRLVMARHLGRPMSSREYVHHLNGIRDDNRIENLELWRKSQPPGIRVEPPHCSTCTCPKH